jgi:hypothetical protein
MLSPLVEASGASSLLEQAVRQVQSMEQSKKCEILGSICSIHLIQVKYVGFAVKFKSMPLI